MTVRPIVERLQSLTAGGMRRSEGYAWPQIHTGYGKPPAVTAPKLARGLVTVIVDDQSLASGRSEEGQHMTTGKRGYQCFFGVHPSRITAK